MSESPVGVINGINGKRDEAFKYLYDTYYASLCRYAKRFVGEFMDEEDVVQEIFVKLWEREGSFENMRALSAYLYRSVHNACLVFIRDQKEIREEELIRKLGEIMEFDSPDNEQLLIEEEYYRQIFVVLNSLPEERRVIVEMTMEGMKNEDIARQIHVSVNTVKTLKKKAYVYLREQLSRDAWSFLFTFL
ncbi:MULTISPECIES: RNA polymerase sigma-70 factor [Butyricimonas]|uniref:RNA polymerase sigma-70 factor n=1 Tax=Butyricimonas TaxID=574697 RepID=UPI0007FB2DBF|nr:MULTISPECIES: RNA polymerase sigma-70 factor [Butyricimonas]